MKTLTAPLTTEKDAEQSGWVELYDIYLKSAITTPWGTLSTLRLVPSYGQDFSFFTPTISPEPTGTQGDAATYKPWPIKREQIRGSQRFQNDKLSVVASNVTKEFAQMLVDVDWYDVWFVIRKVSTTIISPSADDCAVVFIGQVDSAKITNQQLQFMVSNDLGNLQTVAPRENMHQDCRFNWADDQCTAIRFLQENYKAKTCGDFSLRTRVKTSDFTEDGGRPGYIQQDVTVDAATDKITLTAHGLGNADRVKFSYATGGSMPGGLTVGVWYYIVNAATDDFKVALTEAGAAIDITSAGSLVQMDSTAPYGVDLIDALDDSAITGSSAQLARSLGVIWLPPHLGGAGLPTGYVGHGLMLNDLVQFSAGTAPNPLSLFTTYYAIPITFYYFKLAATVDGPALITTNTGSNLILDVFTDSLANRVQASDPGAWRIATSDWGTLSQGYYQIPDQQAGLKNPLLKPWIEFDLGSPKMPRVWRLATELASKLEELTRMIEIFAKLYKAQAVTANASTDQITLTAHGLQLGDQVVIGGTAPGGITAGNAYFVRDVTANDFKVAATEGDAAIDLTSAGSSVTIDAYRFQMYFELPPKGGVLYDCLNPKAPLARWWRICIRSRWAETLYLNILSEVRAHEHSRNWWADGVIHFDAATATPELRDVTRKVLGSYTGAADVALLPATPINGDTFVIERSCPRTFNACCERRNWENFGGFLDLPHQMIIR